MFATGILTGAERPLPESVIARVLVKREANELRLLVRVPLSVVRDIQFPVRGDTAYLDLNAVQLFLHSAASYWVQDCFQVYENGRQVSSVDIARARIAPFSDESFRSFDTAAAHFAAPALANDVNLLLDQAWFDIDFDYSLESGSGKIAILPQAGKLGARVTTQIQYVAKDHSVRNFSFEGNSGLVYLEPGDTEVAKQFAGFGISLVIRSAEILLLVFCLVLPIRRTQDFRWIAALFVIGLTFGFLSPALGLLPQRVWVNPLIETTGALIILFTALLNIGGLCLRSRIALAAIGGLAYGLYSCSALSGKMQFDGLHHQFASLAYWLGLVIAVVLSMCLVFVVLLALLRSNTRRLELIVVTGLAADTSLGWLEERWSELRKIPWQKPTLDADFFAVLLQMFAIAVVVGGACWFLRGWWQSRAKQSSDVASQGKVAS